MVSNLNPNRINAYLTDIIGKPNGITSITHKRIKYEPNEGSKLPDFRGQTTLRHLGYNSDEEEPKTKKRGLELMD